MFERFTSTGRRVIVLAQEEARFLRHKQIGSEHLLLAVLHGEDPVAAGALHALGITLERCRDLLMRDVGRGQDEPTGHIPFTPHAKQAMAEAARAADEGPDGTIGPAELLLGLTRVRKGRAVQLLAAQGADPARIREMVLSRVVGPPRRLIARFRVDGFEPREVSGVAADWFGVLTFEKAFTAGILGRATTVFLASGDDGNRAYVAVERITGTLEGDTDGVEGSVTVQHGGLESDPDATFGHIVPGTGTGPFAGWQGSARIDHDGDGAFFVIDLT